MSVNFEIPTVTVKVGEGEFTVRGMNSEEVVFLTQFYLEDLTNAVAKYGKKSVQNRQSITAFVLDLAKDFPLMCAEIISRCADAPEDVDKFRRLPFVKAAEAIKAIIDLSVEDGAQLKKVAAGLVSLLEANGLQLGPLSEKLQTIIKASENPSQD